MVGSLRSQDTRENNFRGRETTGRKQNTGKAGLPSKSHAGAWEKRVSKQALLFRCLQVSLEKHPVKRGTWGPDLQRDWSSKESKHLLIQPLGRAAWADNQRWVPAEPPLDPISQTGWRGAQRRAAEAAAPASGRLCHWENRPARRRPLRKGTWGCPPTHPGMVGHSRAASYTCSTFCPTPYSCADRDFVPGSAPTCTQQPIFEPHPTTDRWKASVGINPEAAPAQRWVREHV